MLKYFLKISFNHPLNEESLSSQFLNLFIIKFHMFTQTTIGNHLLEEKKLASELFSVQLNIIIKA